MNIDFYNHYCGECHHWYPCATEKEGGAGASAPTITTNENEKETTGND